MTLPVACFSVLVLFYIEEVAVWIEEPFWGLVLEAFSQGISLSLDGIVAAHQEIIRQSKHQSPHVVITHSKNQIQCWGRFLS
jgi:hypothetical protein